MSRSGGGAAGAVAVAAGLAVCCGLHVALAAGGLSAVLALLPGWRWVAAALAVAASVGAAGVVRRRRRRGSSP